VTAEPRGPYGIDQELWSDVRPEAAIERARVYLASGDRYIGIRHVGAVIGLSVEEVDSLREETLYQPIRHVQVFNPDDNRWYEIPTID
jgi:hypothetical protein